jgi:ligand-binding sensor domain-containing protein
VYVRPGEVWIGTARFGENAIEGITGLILHRPARNEWRQFSRRNSRISGDLVWDIAEDSNALWVTTDRGISRYGWDSKNFSSWYWHKAKGGGWTLTSKPPGELVEELVK